MNNYQLMLAREIGEKVRRTLVAQKTIKPDTAVYVWPREERVACLIDPIGITNIDALLSPRMHHHVQTACQGRRVVFTNHRGAFIQVAYHPEPHVELSASPIDWTQQRMPLDVPIGATRRGPLWVSLGALDAVLIGGARRMGKTRLIHGWVQALARGRQTLQFLWDGKNGIEFGRYRELHGVTVADDLRDALAPISAAVREREHVFRALGVTSLAEHNARSRAPLPAIALVIDEAAFVPAEAQAALVDLVARCGALGVYPVFATQRPDAENLRGLLRANLSTRIALPVASRHDSQIILGQSGAEKLAKTPGRLLIAHQARLIEAQAFTVDLGAQLSPGAGGSLSADEKRCAHIALAAYEGRFLVNDIAMRSGLSRDFVLALAQRWELTGWLTPIQTNARGHRIGRLATDQLRDIAGAGLDLGDFGTLAT
jgi:hypothetical protein